MMATRRVAWGLCLLTVIAVAGYAKFLWVRAHSAAPGAIARLGRELPPLPVFDAAGRQVDIAKAARGSKSIIAFYSGSCRVCQEVIPLLQPFPPALRLFLIHTKAESSPQSPAALRLAGASVFSDRNDVFSRSLPLTGVPAFLFVDERGVLRDGLVGKRALYRLRRKLQEFAQVNP